MTCDDAWSQQHLQLLRVSSLRGALDLLGPAAGFGAERGAQGTHIHYTNSFKNHPQVASWSHGDPPAEAAEAAT